MNAFDEALGKRLTILRMRKEIPQKNVAIDLKMSSTKISQQEHGLRKVSVADLMRYSQFYDCPIEKLLGGLEKYL